MQSFEAVRFHGSFRSYQQTVLEHAQRHLRDGRIHIVAAPGSGKTILGLELVRQLGKPALLLSPSVTIRQQWGERFMENFAPEGAEETDYLSFDLKQPALLTSVTYQALHAAFHGLLSQEEADSGAEEGETEDFTGFDLLQQIRQAGIGTVCLDEAHHLRSEWQKALERFLKELGSAVTVIALTATPPYDSTPAEWNRYIELCGEIDEEIFVPQLVAQKSLCPHQDYIYFNYPTQEETQVLRIYREKAAACAEQLSQEGVRAMNVADTDNEELVLSHAEDFGALCSMVLHTGNDIPAKLSRLVTIPTYRLSVAEKAFQFILDTPDLFGEDLSERLRAALSREGLVERKKVCLCTNDKLNRLLVSSVGKLNSINAIVRAELDSLGDGLRMLILTDHIKKDLKKLIGTQEPITAMGTVPIFESVRRCCNARVAMLSGTLVILPNEILPQVRQLARERNIDCTVKPLESSVHSEVHFSGSNKNKVALLTDAFQRGLIQILIGTKSLLGEGWDSPCINSLILASFVGSFMLSNQMRGRAIRMDRNNPEKASNIWHLVTLEPKSLTEKLVSGEAELSGSDYETLQRRFECFLAPAYHTDVIESGIQRLDVITPPYDEAGIARINREMLSLSADRAGMKKRWQTALRGNPKPQIVQACEVSPKVQPNGFLMTNVLRELAVLLLFLAAQRGLSAAIFAHVPSVFMLVARLALWAVFLWLFTVGFLRLLRFCSPKKTVKTLTTAVLKTLQEIGQIESTGASVQVESDALGNNILCMLKNGTEHEKTVFTKAITELLSAIDDPRYVLVQRTRLFGIEVLRYSHSYACPAVIGTKKEFAERLAKRIAAGFTMFYTRNESGSQRLRLCKKRSYLNRNACLVRSQRRAQ